MKHLAFAILCCAPLAACNDASSGAAAAKPTDQAPTQVAPAATATYKLPSVSLQVDAPGGGEIMQVGKGDAVSVAGGVVVAVMKEPKTSDEEKSDDVATYHAKNFKSEALADGWVATFDNDGPSGQTFFVKSRRDIAGTSYLCQTSSKKAEDIALSVAACKTLRK